MKHKIIFWFVIGLVSIPVIRFLLQPESNESVNARIKERMIKHEIRRCFDEIDIIYRGNERKIPPQEMDKIVSEHMNWRVWLYLTDSWWVGKKEKPDISKPWNDEQNFAILNQETVVKRNISPSSTAENQFAGMIKFVDHGNYDMTIEQDTIPAAGTGESQFVFILIFPANDDNTEYDNFLLLESCLDGHHWAEPRGVVKMTTNELLELNREDRKKARDNKIYYCTRKSEWDFGSIKKDKDLLKVLKKLDDDEFLVIK